jgi:hypothetical protein
VVSVSGMTAAPGCGMAPAQVAAAPASVARVVDVRYWAATGVAAGVRRLRPRGGPRRPGTGAPGG